MAIAALNRGDKVIATARARSLSQLEDLKGRGAETLELDVTAPIDNLKAVAAKAVGIYGKIDVVVNNAGMSHQSNLCSLSSYWLVQGISSLVQLRKIRKTSCPSSRVLID